MTLPLAISTGTALRSASHARGSQVRQHAVPSSARPNLFSGD